MRAGAARHRVRLERATKTRTANGGVTDSWVAVKSTWAAIEPLRGREYDESDQMRSEVTHRIEMRWREGVDSQLRVRWGTRTFQIVSVINPSERRMKLALMCKETT